MSKPRGAKIVSIQALRGLASLSVLFGHAQTEASQMSPTFFRIEFSWGFGVDLFFVLSGFVMVFSSHGLFRQHGGPQLFLMQRFFRVAPLYWLFTILIVIAALVFADQLETTRLTTASIVSSFTFIPWPRWDGALRPLLSLGWTLNYEMFFYALFAAALLLPRRAGLFLLTIFMLALVMLGSTTFHVYPPLRFWTDSILVEFVFGVLLGWLYIERPIRHAPRLAIALTLVGAAFLFSLQAFAEAPRFLTQGIPATAFVAAALLAPPPPLGSLQRLFADWIGESSYSLYLSHPFAFAIVKLIWPFAPGGGYDWLYVAVAASAAIVGGIACFLLIERPLLKAFNKPRTNQSQPGLASA